MFVGLLTSSQTVLNRTLLLKSKPKPQSLPKPAGCRTRTPVKKKLRMIPAIWRATPRLWESVCWRRLLCRGHCRQPLRCSHLYLRRRCSKWNELSRLQPNAWTVVRRHRVRQPTTHGWPCLVHQVAASPNSVRQVRAAAMRPARRLPWLSRRSWACLRARRDAVRGRGPALGFRVWTSRKSRPCPACSVRSFEISPASVAWTAPVLERRRRSSKRQSVYRYRQESRLVGRAVLLFSWRTAPPPAPRCLYSPCEGW